MGATVYGSSGACTKDCGCRQACNRHRRWHDVEVDARCVRACFREWRRMSNLDYAPGERRS